MDDDIDQVYDEIDECFRAGQFTWVDESLKIVSVTKAHTSVLLAILTATLAAKSRLPSRAAFFERVEEELKARGEWSEGLLVGLD